MSEPRISRAANLAWGLLGIACTLVVAVLLAGPLIWLVITLEQAGVLAVATAHLPPRVEPLLPEEARGVLLVAVFGPWLSAGVLVGRRERVRTVLVVSAMSAVLFSGLAMVNQLSAVGFKEAMGFGYVSVVSGLTAAALCGIRHRWKC